MQKLVFSIYRYNPDVDQAPRMQDYTLDNPDGRDMMVLDALVKLKEQDPTLSFRRSCREGVCGSDGVNMNGKNGLACITPLSAVGLKGGKIVVRPLPGLPVIRDLVIDMSQFYTQYEKVKPYLINDGLPPAGEFLQTPEERAKLDGLYECILCACCSTSCPSFWWNPDKFIGPAGLLHAYRFLADSRDTATEQRLNDLDDAFSVFRCHGIMNCVSVCPKGLNPTKAIGQIKSMLLNRAL
ncbi:succinate dehydrogenase iron-sulfur subunit [Alishewanella sp. 16-MA]|uniref:succinate dehydrogenase n=1 Tax=Alishewanella maricola TaxID=2795740 RepID=A0ABS8C0R7_9ALTE|nr:MULTISPECIES: succinate dehydrogenase iron-sulfur subunit [Gammaproteobacteria]MDP5035798.1 succinate dehydrogenase iron-sulfur subunit [Alishewanella sp.]MCB5225917.1 succinate dehydrogenase iron-sulfur subunit [Alishewanella maricola]MCC5453014.1 succinate dehydrogenase iron-sulfur subunit [Rheinheimera sp. UJ51]MCF4009437.1 succinate dehydrogenase iron-sulfur subunit [Rheinheimera sp. UJ63]MDP5186728.1 succinate dehydrogenase iron-sulfur subunit [Alishewanella sp.]